MPVAQSNDSIIASSKNSELLGTQIVHNGVQFRYSVTSNLTFLHFIFPLQANISRMPWQILTKKTTLCRNSMSVQGGTSFTIHSSPHIRKNAGRCRVEAFFDGPKAFPLSVDGSFRKVLKFRQMARGQMNRSLSHVFRN